MKPSFIRFILLAILTCCLDSTQAQDFHLTIAEKLKAFQLDKKDIEIHIDKTAHTLTLVAGNTTLKQYKCVFGNNTLADKKYQGDRCTPEGEFHILAKYPHPEWDKFMLIDYPTKESWKKYQANRANGLIPQNASIGCSIGIHGVPKNKDYLIDKCINWTLGCISLSNQDIQEIYESVDVGTKVTIVK